MFRQRYTHTTPSFSMSNLGSAPYTPRCNGQTYANVNGNYQAPYITIAYTNPIPLPGSLARLWPSYANNNTMWYNTHDSPEHSGFAYKTPPQFSFRPQPVELMPARDTADPCVNPNNLTIQLAAILRVFWYRTQGLGVCLSKTLPRLL
jgi:hypothetical protein